MARKGERKCLCCGRLFVPDRRSRTRQRFCVTARCQRASKAASQASWLSRPANRGYFRDPVHLERVRQWRAAHPGYAQRGRRARLALQDPLLAQVVEPTQESVDRGVPALQDFWNAPAPVLAGLIAHLFELTLQDDMAATARHLVQRGQDLILRRADQDDHTRGAPAPASAMVLPGSGVALRDPPAPGPALPYPAQPRACVPRTA